MKSSLIILASLLCITSAYASGIVKIAGTISNPISDTIKVTFDNAAIFYDKHEVKAGLDKDGKFALSFEVQDPYTSVIIKNGQQGTEIFTMAGMDLYLTLDGKDFDKSVHYEGKGKELANFMAKHMLEIGLSWQISRSVSMFMGKPAQEFEAELKKAEDKEFAFYEANKGGIPASFETFWKSYFRYFGYSCMLKYPMLHTMSKQNSFSVKVDTSRENYSIVNNVPFAFNDDMIGLSTYKEFAFNYYGSKLAAAGFNNITKQRKNDSIFFLLYSAAPPKTAELAIGTILYRESGMNDAERNKTLLATYKEHFPQSPNLAILESKMLGFKKISPGQSAPDINFKTFDGKEMKLSDLKGKVVVIDFWASWCGPCLAQVPAAKKLEEHFKEKNVVFLNISIDEDQDKWKEAITIHKIGGINACFNLGWQSSAVKQFSIYALPDYFLLDANGNFAIANCPRPDQGNDLQKEIEKLLQ